jgi:2-dehydropantoate 2-reductase
MSTLFKTIAVVGSGALGLYYGGRLARAGNAVRFLARSDLAVLRARGIVVRAPDGHFTLPDVTVAATPEQIGPVDLVVITLKATANDQLTRLLPPLLHPGTVVLNLQNGLGVDEAAVAGPRWRGRSARWAGCVLWGLTASNRASSCAPWRARFWRGSSPVPRRSAPARWPTCSGGPE